MGNDGNILSKDNSLILRGMAILAIMFHNYLYRIGFSPANEMSFVQAKANDFFHALAHPGVLLHPGFSIGCHIVSFLGWLGVPVFVFLTGYGLSMKYPPGVRLDRFNCLKNSYLKLIFLLFPAMMYFVILDILNFSLANLTKRIVYLSMLNNFFYPWLRVEPGTYWYFSLTFQYYLLYHFCRNWFTPLKLLILSILSLAALYPLTLIGGPLLSIYKHCFPGWFPLFALGVWFARSDMPQKWLEEANWGKAFFLFATMSILVLAMQFHAIPWLAMPIAGFFAFLGLAQLVLHIRPIDGMLKWIGGISSSLFVCHPIAYTLVFRFHLPDHGFSTSLAAYSLIAVILAYFYKKLQKMLTP